MDPTSLSSQDLHATRAALEGTDRQTARARNFVALYGSTTLTQQIGQHLQWYHRFGLMGVLVGAAAGAIVGAIRLQRVSPNFPRKTRKAIGKLWFKKRRLGPRERSRVWRALRRRGMKDEQLQKAFEPHDGERRTARKMRRQFAALLSTRPVPGAEAARPGRASSR